MGTAMATALLALSCGHMVTLIQPPPTLTLARCPNIQMLKKNEWFPETSDTAVLKRRFKELAAEYHPDRVGDVGDDDTVVQFQELSAEYQRLLAKCQTAKQRDTLERELAIIERVYGRDHAQVAITLNNLGLAYAELGDHAKEREMLERALAIGERAYGRDHVELASTLWNLYEANRALGDTVKQREMLERALVINENAYGPDHSETVYCREALDSIRG